MRPKIVAILRMRPHYEIKELVNQFKTHVWGIKETHNGGFSMPPSTFCKASITPSAASSKKLDWMKRPVSYTHLTLPTILLV